MIPSGTIQSTERRAALYWKYVVAMWCARQWEQIDEGFAVADDYGILTPVGHTGAVHWRWR